MAKFGPGVLGIRDWPGVQKPRLHAYPNPFRSATTIAYTVPIDGPVEIRVYDIQGRLVTALLDEAKPAGQYTVSWGGRNDQGAPDLGIVRNQGAGLEMLTTDFDR